MATPIHTAPPQPSPPVDTTGAPMVAANDTAPLHTQTQSTLAPTSEFMRYFLAALPSRYVLRGFFKTIFGTEEANGGLRGILTKALHAPGAFIERALHGKGPRDPASIKNNLGGIEAGGYGAALGLGSMALTYSYSRVVYRDIKNLFSETVADELGKPVDTITDSDIRHSNNKIIQRTLKNYQTKMWGRYATDLLFFPAAWMRKEGLVDAALGLKGVQLFMDTWKRKTTMFEDLITFVSNKINPRNGLGQAINVGEIFDLYQHYAQEYNPSAAFSNVLERSSGEGAVWAQNQPIFLRMTELMNLTYAYKHSSMIDQQTGATIRQADFALPKFIYLLGHDLIDVKHPDETLARIEIANRYGIGAVKEMQTMLTGGATLDQVAARFPIAEHSAAESKQPTNTKNGVIAKGSTVQLDSAENDNTAPHTTVDVDSIASQPLLAQGNAAAIA